ncbi:Uncharacterised protein [Edwardsiella tarda]|nr:Uncharacterised protein [Edwardsiella tarda]
MLGYGNCPLLFTFRYFPTQLIVLFEEARAA